MEAFIKKDLDMENKYLNIVKRILVCIMNFVVDNTKLVAGGMSLFLTVQVGKTMMYEGMGTGDKIYVYLLLICIVLPASYIVFLILLQILRLVFYVILKILGKRERMSFEDGEFFEKHFTGSSSADYDRKYEQQDYREQYYGYSSQDSQSEGQSDSAHDSGSDYGNRRTDSYQQEASLYRKALQYFGLQENFTEDELKKRYRRAIKQAHPDIGGNKEDAAKINAYYEELKNRLN